MFERIEIPVQPGLDPITVIFETFGRGGRITIICFDMAWTGFYSSPGDRGIKAFFAECGTDYLAGNIGSGRQYKQDKSSQAYFMRVLKSAQDGVKAVQ